MLRVERPTYLGFAGAEDASAAVADKVGDVCAKAAPAIAPMGGLILASIVGAAAAYAVPKVFDAIALRVGRAQEEAQGPDVDLDVEPRDD
jgi:hypothetical protein